MEESSETILTRDEALFRIAKAFYQADRLGGKVKMHFGVRAQADSDGNHVIDVNLTPLDQQAANTLPQAATTRHMQFLETMVPPALLAQAFVVQLIPLGANDLEIQVLERFVSASAP